MELLDERNAEDSALLRHALALEDAIVADDAILLRPGHISPVGHIDQTFRISLQFYG